MQRSPPALPGCTRQLPLLGQNLWAAEDTTLWFSLFMPKPSDICSWCEDSVSQVPPVVVSMGQLAAHHSLPQACVHPISHHKAPNLCICLSICLCLWSQQNLSNVLQGTAGTSSPTSCCAHPREVQPYSTLPLLPHIIGYWGACFTEQHVGWWSITFISQLWPSEDMEKMPTKGGHLEASLFFSLHWRGKPRLFD